MDLKRYPDPVRGAPCSRSQPSYINVFPPTAQAAQPSDSNTVTPIKQAIVIVGENRTFDHLFATYQPVPGETVNNLFSQKIITPSVNDAKAHQYSADVTGDTTCKLSPTTGKTL